jgi:hypothetical protein
MSWRPTVALSTALAMGAAWWASQAGFDPPDPMVGDGRRDAPAVADVPGLALAPSLRASDAAAALPRSPGRADDRESASIPRPAPEEVRVPPEEEISEEEERCSDEASRRRRQFESRGATVRSVDVLAWLRSGRLEDVRAGIGSADAGPVPRDDLLRLAGDGSLPPALRALALRRAVDEEERQGTSARRDHRSVPASDEVVARVAQGLEAGPPPLRLVALESLRELGDEGALLALRWASRHPPDAETASWIAEAIAKSPRLADRVAQVEHAVVFEALLRRLNFQRLDVGTWSAMTSRLVGLLDDEATRDPLIPSITATAEAGGPFAWLLLRLHEEGSEREWRLLADALARRASDPARSPGVAPLLPVLAGGSSGLRVLSARYGTGTRWMDVTDVVSRAVRSERLLLHATNDVFGGDPAFGIVKDLEVEYSFGGRSRRSTAREGQILVLPSR